MNVPILPPVDAAPAPSLPATRFGPRSEAPLPLLPGVLTGPAALLWLWLLPIGVLLLLNVQGYQLVEGNMNSDQRALAWWLGFAGLVNLALGGLCHLFA